jgi:flagella synthesis protein FlgN
MDQVASALQQCLQDEINAMGDFEKLLMSEQEALVAGKVDILTDITSSKTRMVSQITALEQQRCRHLASLGFAADAAGMQAYLNQAPEQAQISDTWNTLLASARSAQENNRTNGMLIQKHLSFTQGALSILQRGDNSANVYGPNGQPKLGQFSSRGLSVT